MARPTAGDHPGPVLDVIGIVGAGLTGLALGHELARRGVAHTVFEAADRPGGVVRSRRVEGHVLDEGPQRGRLTPALVELIGELGLAPELILAPPGLPLYIYADGKLRRVPFSLAGLLRTDLLPWPAKLRLALEPLTGAPRIEERVSDLFARKIGRAAYERLVGPLYGGLYASDPADMIVGLSLAHVLREFGVRRSLLGPLLRRGGIAAPRAFSFAGGMQALTDALYAGDRASVRLAAPVRGLSPRPREAGRTELAWSVELDGESVPVGRVVLTCPARSAAAILEEAAPEAAERIGRLRYNPLAVVHLQAGADLHGMGYQVALNEDFATRGVTWNGSLFGRDSVVTAYLGGAKRPAVVEEPDDRLAAIAAHEFERVTGVVARPLAVGRGAMPAWDVSWTSIQDLVLPLGVMVAAGWESRPGIAGRLAQARGLARRLAGETAR